MGHVRGAPYHPQTQGKIERWHQTLKNRILLENYYLPGDLPENGTLLDLVHSFVGYARSHRTELPDNSAVAVITALREAYPCSVTNQPSGRGPGSNGGRKRTAAGFLPRIKCKSPAKDGAPRLACLSQQVRESGQFSLFGA